MFHVRTRQFSDFTVICSVFDGNGCEYLPCVAADGRSQGIFWDSFTSETKARAYALRTQTAANVDVIRNRQQLAC